jgi:capsular exopolysaccharide synthesis family protein
VEPVQYLRALRQWWWVIVASTLIGVLLAAFAMPSGATSYTARHTLISFSGGESESIPIPSLAQMAVLVGSGDVPTRVAEQLGESRSEVVDGLNAFSDDTSSSLTIEVEGDNAQEVAARADAFAEALIASVTADAVDTYNAQVAAAQKKLTDLQAELARTIDPTTRDQLTDEIAGARDGVDTAIGSGPPEAGIQSIDAATVDTEASTGQKQRIAIAGFVGLLIGAGLALILSRFDTRIHTRELAEDAFGAPVIGEIPLLSRKALHAGITTAARAESPAAEAYRGLRSALMLSPRRKDPSRRARRQARDVPADGGTSKVIMVMSPGSGEGKTTCVANLAAAFAESDKSVLVLSCDLRRPTIDGYLGVNGEGPSIVDVLADGVPLDDAARGTTLDDVRIVPSGGPVANPGELFAHGEELVVPARHTAEVVLIDTPPVLATDDVSSMIPLVDDVVLVCRAGSTAFEAAARTSERLTRLGAPIAGVVIIGAQSVPTVRGYYRSYVPGPGDRVRRARRRDAGPVTAPASNGAAKAPAWVAPSDVLDDASREDPDARDEEVASQDSSPATTTEQSEMRDLEPASDEADDTPDLGPASGEADDHGNDTKAPAGL